MHFLSGAGGNHIFEGSELFIHFGPSTTLDQTVGSLAGNLPTCRTGGTGLFLLGRGGRIGHRLWALRGIFGILCLGLCGFWFHLNDLASSGRWRRQVEVLEWALGCARPSCVTRPASREIWGVRGRGIRGI